MQLVVFFLFNLDFFLDYRDKKNILTFFFYNQFHALNFHGFLFVFLNLAVWYFAQGSFVKNTLICHEQIKLQTLKHAGCMCIIHVRYRTALLRLIGKLV